MPRSGHRNGSKYKKSRVRNRRQDRRPSSKNRKQRATFPSLENQLSELSLGLKDVPGDGNCVFRAFIDQLGNKADHSQLRSQVVEYMARNRKDFEPFYLNEDNNFPGGFDEYLSNLAEDGTFVGNDGIVAFARLYGLTVVIHQLNSPPWQIRGTDDSCRIERQLHISYHDGVHYNSVRSLKDLSGNGPASVFLLIDSNNSSDEEDDCNEDGEINDEIDSCDSTRITSEFDRIWSENGTGTRILGATAADKANNTGRRRSARRNRKDLDGEMDGEIPIIPVLQGLSI